MLYYTPEHPPISRLIEHKNTSWESVWSELRDRKIEVSQSAQKILEQGNYEYTGSGSTEHLVAIPGMDLLFPCKRHVRLDAVYGSAHHQMLSDCPIALVPEFAIQMKPNDAVGYYYNGD